MADDPVVIYVLTTLLIAALLVALMLFSCYLDSYHEMFLVGQ